MEDFFSIEDDKNKVIETINKVIEEIKSLKQELFLMRDSVEEINKVNLRLKQIESTLNPKPKWFKKKIELLDDALEELKEIRFCINLQNKEKMLKIIDRNLQDGMKLDGSGSNFRNVLYNGVSVGVIEVLDDCIPEIKIKVSIGENCDEFDIQDYLRIYSIISFINTKFNYKDSKNVHG